MTREEKILKILEIMRSGRTFYEMAKEIASLPLDIPTSTEMRKLAKEEYSSRKEFEYERFLFMEGMKAMKDEIIRRNK